MAHKYRELVVWQRAMELVTQVYALSRGFPREEQFGLISQLRRAAISIPLNVAEGVGSDSSREFARFLTIALRSAYETMTAIDLSVRLGYADQSNVVAILSQLDQVAAMLSVLAKRMQDRADHSSGESREQYVSDSVVEAAESDYRLLTTDYPVVLRAAQEDDLPTITALLKSAFGERMVKQLEHGRTVVALVGGELVGCIAYEANDEHVYLGRVAVLASHRHHGIGGALIGRVEADARLLGTPRVRLAVSAAEPHLREWYERAGYVLVEECYLPGFDEPAYLMLEKDVSG